MQIGWLVGWLVGPIIAPRAVENNNYKNKRIIAKARKTSLFPTEIMLRGSLTHSHFLVLY